MVTSESHDIEKVLDALGDRTRRRILELVAVRPTSVVAISRQVTVSRPAVSQHLRQLLEAGLVARTQDGRENIYPLRMAGIALIRDFADQFWDRALRRLAKLADSDAHNDASGLPQKEQSNGTRSN